MSALTVKRASEQRVERKADVKVRSHGTIFTFEIRSVNARRWIRANVPAKERYWLGGRLAVSHRYARDLAGGMIADGLAVR